MCTITPYFFIMIILSMHLLPRMIVMLGFICMGSFNLQGTQGERKKIKNAKVLPTVGLKPATFEFEF